MSAAQLRSILYLAAGLWLVEKFIFKTPKWRFNSEANAWEDIS